MAYYDKTSKHRLYSDECGGEIVVHVTPGGTSKDYGHCDPKAPVRLVVKRGRKTLWAPESPLCLGPLHDPHTREGRREAAEAAKDFFEYHRCGRGRPGDED